MSKPWYIELYEYFPDYDAEPYAQGTKGEVDFIERELAYDRTKAILNWASSWKKCRRRRTAPTKHNPTE